MCNCLKCNEEEEEEAEGKRREGGLRDTTFITRKLLGI
jgi:hypothetical protein